MTRALLVVALAACGARTGVRTTVDLDAAIPDLPDAPLTQAVHGKFVLRYFPDSGEVDLPKDLTKSIIDARVAGTIYPGVGLADGTFSIAYVPPGPFMLRVDDTYIDGAQDGVTLTKPIPGRPDADRTLGFVPINISLQNVAPITNSTSSWDIFMIQSSNAGCIWFSLDFQLTPKLPNGVTAFTNETMSGQTSSEYGCHIDASKGDKATLLQIRNPIASDPTPLTIRKLELPGFTGPAAKTVVDGTMSDVPASNTFHGDFRPSTFLAAIPNATVSIGVGEQPAPFNFGLSGGGLSGLIVDGPVTFDYMDPFPSGLKWLGADAFFQFPLTPLGSVPLASGILSSTRRLDLTTAANAPIALVLSPPKNPTVGDAAPLASVAHVGLRPTIHWSRPEHAPPGPIRYSVRLIGGMATIWTTATSITVPAGVLQPNIEYIARVQAEWTPNPSDFAKRPIDDVNAWPESSRATTGVFSP